MTGEGLPLDAPARRALGRMISESARDPLGIAGLHPQPEPRFRIGITGSPGAGKSSLIGRLAQGRLAGRRHIAILAVDPTSPLSGGSVLGDRIRMEALSRSDAVYVRSLPSRAAFDGLCDNIEPIMRVLERTGFDEIILETVGAGQVQHTVRGVCDTLVMVLSPHAGDAIQAMKAGLMEMADIYVVNKSDLPDAGRAAADIRATVARARLAQGWLPPVILTSTQTGAGIAELSEAIDAHRAQIVAERDPGESLRGRLRHHAGEILQRRLACALSSAADDAADVFDRLLDGTLKQFADM